MLFIQQSLVVIVLKAETYAVSLTAVVTLAMLHEWKPMVKSGQVDSLQLYHLLKDAVSIQVLASCWKGPCPNPPWEKQPNTQI